MQGWITGYSGFLHEAIGLFVDEVELCILFRATNCHFSSWRLWFEAAQGRTRSSRDLDRKVLI